MNKCTFLFFSYFFRTKKKPTYKNMIILNYVVICCENYFSFFYISYNIIAIIFWCSCYIIVYSKTSMYIIYRYDIVDYVRHSRYIKCTYILFVCVRVYLKFFT